MQVDGACAFPQHRLLSRAAASPTHLASSLACCHPFAISKKQMLRLRGGSEEGSKRIYINLDAGSVNKILNAGNMLSTGEEVEVVDPDAEESDHGWGAASEFPQSKEAKEAWAETRCGSKSPSVAPGKLQ